MLFPQYAHIEERVDVVRRRTPVTYDYVAVDRFLMFHRLVYRSFPFATLTEYAAEPVLVSVSVVHRDVDDVHVFR